MQVHLLNTNTDFHFEKMRGEKKNALPTSHFQRLGKSETACRVKM
jgi:hypothetical protein